MGDRVGKESGQHPMRSVNMFFVIFHAIYFAMNLYVFWRLLGFFGVRQPLVLWPLVAQGLFSQTVATNA
jgi:hypothetical protein